MRIDTASVIKIVTENGTIRTRPVDKFGVLIDYYDLFMLTE
jgi:hypothetical protein